MNAAFENADKENEQCLTRVVHVRLSWRLHVVPLLMMPQDKCYVRVGSVDLMPWLIDELGTEVSILNY